jgi:hypothetical protein
VALRETVSIVLFTTLSQAGRVASESGSNSISGGPEVFLHDSFSGVMLFFGNYEFLFSSIQKSLVSFTEVFNVSIIFGSKSFLIVLTKSSPVWSTTSFIHDTLSH